MLLNVEEEMERFIKENGTDGEFKPVAFYLESLDIIIVLNADCSTTEENKNEIFSLLKANHSGAGYVGFAIENVKSIFGKVLPKKNIITIREIIDIIQKYHPDKIVDDITNEFKDILNLEVSLD